MGSSHDDSAWSAWDLANGVAQRWKFFADGPIRYAPVAAKGRVYLVAADDGCLYCLDLASGKQVFRVKGGPA